MRRRSRICANWNLENFTHVALFLVSFSDLVGGSLEVEQLHFPLPPSLVVYKWIEEPQDP
jgi:hypothetical protein